MKLLDYIEKDEAVDIEYYLSKSASGKIVRIKDGKEVNFIYQRDKEDLLKDFVSHVAMTYDQVEQWEILNDKLLSAVGNVAAVAEEEKIYDFAIITDEDFNNNEDVFNLWIDREVVLAKFVTKKGKEKVEPVYVGSHGDDLVYFTGFYGHSVDEILKTKPWHFIELKEEKKEKEMLDKRYKLSKKELEDYVSLTNEEGKSWVCRTVIQKEQISKKNKTLNFFERLLFTYNSSDKKVIRTNVLVILLIIMVAISMIKDI